MNSPYVYFGGKRSIAPYVWQRLGDTPNFIDPFFGGNSFLLCRPDSHKRGIETINDMDGMVANFWRALQAAPDEVAHYADWPSNENDLHARHSWLVTQKFNTDFIQRLEGEADYFDAKIAGWWVWGMAQWIGSGFCSGRGAWKVIDGKLIKAPADEQPGVIHQQPNMSTGRGTSQKSLGVSRNMPRLSTSGQGINHQLNETPQGVARQLPHLGDRGQGVNRQLLYLRSDPLATTQDDLYSYMAALAARMARVRVCCGDWSRVTGPAVYGASEPCAIVLDPPYTHEGRQADLYNHDDVSIANEARAWAIENGSNRKLRIAYFGYANDFEWPPGWTQRSWSANGGFDCQNKNGNDNKHREMVYFSPHCIPEDKQLNMFANDDGID